jgi:hypothetical protein
MDNAAGTPLDISGSMNQARMTFTNELGFEAVQRLCCGMDGVFELNIWYTTAASEGRDTVFTWYFGATRCTPRTVSIYLPDKNVGSDHLSGEFLMETMDVTADRGDAAPMPIMVRLLPNNGINRSTAAT